MAAWHRQPAPIGYVAAVAAITICVGSINILQWLFAPTTSKLTVEIEDRQREDKRLEEQLRVMKLTMEKSIAKEDLRWANVPNVTSIEGEIATERAAREGFDAVSKQQREEALRRIDKLEERQTDVLQRLSRLEAVQQKFTVRGK